MFDIAACSGVGFLLKQGATLTVKTATGGQVCDLFCINAKDPGERFSALRSLDYADKLNLSRGDHLYSNRSLQMFSIIEDSCGDHDLLMPPCSLKMFQIVAGNRDYHESCLENLGTALAKLRPWLSR